MSTTSTTNPQPSSVVPVTVDVPLDFRYDALDLPVWIEGSVQVSADCCLEDGAVKILRITNWDGVRLLIGSRGQLGEFRLTDRVFLLVDVGIRSAVRRHCDTSNYVREMLIREAHSQSRSGAQA